jgi:lipopolysaccharide/colanic/teichoic acid biosynthesis glycosyltransferase
MAHPRNIVHKHCLTAQSAILLFELSRTPERGVNRMNPVVEPIRRTAAVATLYGDGAVATDLLPTITFPNVRPREVKRDRSERARRNLNVVAASILLVLTLPVMLVVALLVMLTSRGPILYTQTRVGVDRRTRFSVDGRRRVDYGGRLFKIYKFRTMRIDADRSGEVWASPDDPRVTPVGRVLRKYRLDELPQLFNVLKGDMNLVGPRPEQPRIFTNLRDRIDRYAERQQVLPGITGLAQVSQNYDATIDDVRQKILFDLHYISHRSWQQDLKVMLKTVPVVIFKRGAW